MVAEPAPPPAHDEGALRRRPACFCRSSAIDSAQARGVGVTARILIVEDDAAMQYAISHALESEGFAVDVAGDGEAGLAAARGQDYDVVLLDWMLPKLSGIEVCRALRAESAVPIIMLTAKGTEVDRVLGLELGADDYVAKPFSARELASRIRAVLRRGELERSAGGATIRAGDVEIELASHKVTVGGRDVRLTPSE